MSDTFRRGDTSERKVGYILHELLEDDSALLRLGIRILRIKHALPNSDLDQRKADYLVLIEHIRDGQHIPIPLQVKSSERHRREFEEMRNRENLPHLMFIAVHFRDDLTKVKRQVLQCLKTAVNLFRRGLESLFNTYQSFFADSKGEEHGEYVLPRKKARRRRWRERQRYINFAAARRGFGSPGNYCFG